jgi:hypothetical protein
VEEVQPDVDALVDIRRGEALFDLWRREYGRGDEAYTEDRRLALEARLRDGYTSEQIARAIEGAPQGLDIQTICRVGRRL